MKMSLCNDVFVLNIVGVFVTTQFLILNRRIVPNQLNPLIDIGFIVFRAFVRHVNEFYFFPIVLSLFDEPLAEEGLGHALKGFVLALEEVDFVKKTAQHLRDGLLLLKRDWTIELFFYPTF